MIQPLNLPKQYESLRPDLLKAFERLLVSGQFILGQELALFEKEIASFLGVKEAIAVTSGTDALFIAIKALGLNNGDRVLTSPFTFFGTVSAIVNAGAVPVFCDIDPHSFNLDPLLVEKALSEDIEKKIKAIMPVHLYGQACAMNQILAIAKKYSVPVIEDAAQAIGADYEGRKVGGLGDIGAFSFFPTKNLGALGDAGLVTTQDSKLAETVRLIRNHGAKQRYYHDCIGSNFRMDTLQAAFLRVFLPKLPEWLEKRQAFARVYDGNLKDVSDFIQTPSTFSDRNHTYHQYTIRVSKNRDAFQKRLADKNISVSIYYPVPCHLQKAISYLGYREGDFPISERASKEVLSLPIHPEMTEEEQNKVIKVILDSIIA